MAQAVKSRSTARRRNLFGFGRKKRSSVKSKMMIPQMAASAAIMGEYYGKSAGGSSGSVEASHMRQQFDDWLYGSGLDTHGSGVQARLRKTFEAAYKRAAKKNPAVSAAQYRLAQAILSGTARETRMSKKVAREIVDRTPARLRSEYSRNPAMELSTEYHLGYSLGQADRQAAQLRKTLGELRATFDANFRLSPTAQWESFEQAYQAGYGGQMGAAAPNPTLSPDRVKVYPSTRRPGKWDVFVGGIHRATRPTKRGADGYAKRILDANPEPAEPDNEDYRQAKKIAELFHGRPVKETITVTEQIREHDWLWRIGPLVNLKVRTLTKQSATFPFHQDEKNMVHLFCSPDGRQFYLRGGDQEIDLKALGMGPGTDWFRDQMLIGEAKEITYRDKKKFHRFALTEYFHKLGEVSNEKPMLAYDALAKKLSILGGQYRVETEDLIDNMSPGIVN